MYRSKDPRILLCILIFIFSLRTVLANPTNAAGEVAYTDSRIHTVLFFTEGWEFSLPVLELGQPQHLVLKFDELVREPKTYHYTIVQCDADWNPSRMSSNEYLDGFQENPINDYAISINTTVPFVNYRLMIPNDDIKVRLSGNYLLKIWENSEKDHPVLIRPFYVAEKLAEINGFIQNATYEGFKGTSQQISFTVTYPKFGITDPINEIKTVVMQNTRMDNRLTKLKPTFIRQNQLVFEEKTNLFPGSNEFRNFNSKNLQTNGMGVKQIEYIDPYYHLFLETDISGNSEIYRSREDLNGNYLVKNDRTGDSDLEADYTVVHFTYSPPDRVTNDKIFVFGALSNWQCLPSHLMAYNPDKKVYEASILLKQGFYDYQYVLLDLEKQIIDATIPEGSHVETENDYQFLLYYRGFSSRYDRLIGYRTINSVKGR
jgi:hypothetical protein